MNKTVKMIAEAVIALSNKYDIYEDTALEILKAAAGGEQNLAEFIEDEYFTEADDENENDDYDCKCDCCEHECDEDEDDEEVLETTDIEVGKQNRVTIPKPIIEAAEDVNGGLNTKKFNYGDVTAVFYENSIALYFGDKQSEYEDEDGVEKVKLIRPNANGSLQFRANPTFNTGCWVTVSATADGVIHID